MLPSESDSRTMFWRRTARAPEPRLPAARVDPGIEPVGEMPWGTHFCHFHETRAIRWPRTASSRTTTRGKLAASPMPVQAGMRCCATAAVRRDVADIFRRFATIAAVPLARGRRQQYECACDAVDVVRTLARSRAAESGPNEVSPRVASEW